MFAIQLTPNEDERLKHLLSNGVSLVRVTKKARLIRLVADGCSLSRAVGVCANTARSVCNRFAQGGLDNAIYDKPRPGHLWLLTDSQDAQIAAMVCTSPQAAFPE